jgi:hypothetical protein
VDYFLNLFPLVRTFPDFLQITQYDLIDPFIFLDKDEE